MSNFSISNAASKMARQTFGAQVVSKTLDYMNQSGSSSPNPLAPVDKTTFGAQVVTKTLDFMNAKPFGGGSNSDYDFQKDVLQAATVGKGTVFNTNT
ncbi:hypothetical protein JCM16814_28960 [Desulfobaculum senezii]|jgi:hypothetical protein|uniref:hypothetical protein n=1 Tax=Desulfobaculum sp. SPO524 TaxID=3378071 RepID=UPI0038526223